MVPCHRARSSSAASVGALAIAVALLVAAVAFPAGRAGADHGPAAPGAEAAGLGAEAARSGDVLRRLALEHERGDEGARQRLEPLLVEAAARRHEALLALMESDPAAVRAAALPPSVRAALPPSVQDRLEEDLETEGALEVLHADGGPRGGHYWALATPLGKLSLHWAGAEPKGRLTGDRVRVRGLRVGLAMALGAADLVPIAPAALPNALGAQSTLVILVNFTDKAVQPYTPAAASAVVFGTTSDFYRENSFGQTWLAGIVRGWYTIDESSTACSPDRIAQKAEQAAAAAGVDVAAYPRRVYAFPANGCGWWGLGTVGGYPSRAWVRGSFELTVVGHELGHNLGLYHSHALECGPVTLDASCSSIEYGDTLDIMGTGAYHFNAPQKERLGWLGAGSFPPITGVTASGTYSVSAHETTSGGAKALRIPRGGGGGAFYVEARKAVGFDAGLAGTTNAESGVVVHLSQGPDEIYLLDMTPAGQEWWDPALAVGQSFTDGQVTITPLWVDSGGAGVSVDLTPVGCTPAAPTVTLVPGGTVWLAPGGSAAYSVSVRNSDQGGCAEATFALSLSGPGGLAGQFQPALVTVAPGATASATLTVGVAGGTAEGLYQPGVTAAREGGGASGSASASLMVVSALQVAASTDRPAYRRFQFVTATALVTAGGLPAPGVPVTFTVTKSSGQKVKGSAVTGAGGVATYRYWVRWGDTKGAWSVKAVAKKAGLTGLATRPFQVQ
jgi:hypothetical protein